MSRGGESKMMRGYEGGGRSAGRDRELWAEARLGDAPVTDDLLIY